MALLIVTACVLLSLANCLPPPVLHAIPKLNIQIVNVKAIQRSNQAQKQSVYPFIVSRNFYIPKKVFSRASIIARDHIFKKHVHAAEVSNFSTNSGKLTRVANTTPKQTLLTGIKNRTTQLRKRQTTAARFTQTRRTMDETTRGRKFTTRAPRRLTTAVKASRFTKLTTKQSSTTKRNLKTTTITPAAKSTKAQQATTTRRTTTTQPPVVTCDRGFTSRPGSTSCYTIVETSLNWFDADQFCTSFRPGEYSVHLVSVESAEEQNFINTQLLSNKKFKDRDYWTSGNRIDQAAADWKWASVNKEFDYTNWAQGEPSGGGRCMNLKTERSFQWDAKDCDDDRFHFICEYHR